MNVTLVNIPNTKRDTQGNVLAVGPQAGSRWPWLGMVPGCYAPMPFYLAFAASYLHAHGVNVAMLDFVATQRWFPQQWQTDVIATSPDIVVYEVSMPVVSDVLREAEHMHAMGKRVVLCGPHCASESEKLAAIPYVSAVIIGEYEIPLIKIINGDMSKIFRYEHVQDLDTVLGSPWHPYRDPAVMREYYDPSMATPKIQLTVSTSRGCAWHCNYCQWQKVINNKTYRTRSPDTVMDEIRVAMSLAKAHGESVRSIFFDDDTWNLGGAKRIDAMCSGLKGIGLPWSMMGRLDAHPKELFSTMIDAGCVGIRAGIETFKQEALDRTGGRRDAQRQYEAAKYILSQFRGIEVHFTSMRDMPGQTADDWRDDQLKFDELLRIAQEHGNRMHHQVSRVMPFPGTDLYEQMQAAGHGELLANADYNATSDESPLNRAVRELVPMTVKGK